MVGKPLYVTLAQLVDARLNCLKTPAHAEWRDKHEAQLKALVSQFLPSGAGFDSGTALDLDASTGKRLVFRTSFHHMNDSGVYDGWTEHTVVVTPSLSSGFNLRIGGRNRNEIKDYIGDSFHHALGTVT